MPLGNYPTPGMNLTISPDHDREHFECPECSSDRLEEVARAIQYSEIPCFYQGEVDYGDSETEYMDAIRIQCAHCGFEVCEGFQSNLYSYCLERGWIKGRGPEEEGPAANWEV